MRAQLAKGVTLDQCLWDDRTRLNLPGVRAPGNCDFSRLEARDGRFAVAGLCGSPDSSGAIQVAIEGAYSPGRLTYRSEATASANGTRIRIKMDMVSRFAGKCASIPVIKTPSAKPD